MKYIESIVSDSKPKVILEAERIINEEQKLME